MSDYSPPIPYPWQQPHWQNFLQQHEQKRLPHALLVSGQQGIGKWHYIQAMADFLLCLSPKSGLACGTCRSCQLNQSDTHPDKLLLIPEDLGKLIKVDQIRQLSSTIASTAQQGGRKVIILGPVEQLNINAANALLKNLEEPAADTFFLLFSHVMSGVMATIRSRCQLFSMPLPQKDTAINWLQDLGFSGDMELILDMSSGAPLAARSLLENDDTTDKLEKFLKGLVQAQRNSASVDMNIAKEWLDIELSDILEWWPQLLHKLVTKKFENRPPKTVDSTTDYVFVKLMVEVQELAAGFNQQWLFRFMDKLLLSKKQLLQGANPNKQLLLEELLLDWYAIIKSK